jgi:hypothetical protein
MENPLYRLNNDKLLLWLQCKMETLKEELRINNFKSLLTDARATTFRTSNKEKNILSEESLVKISLGLLSEYVDKDLLAPLISHYL